jgi:hypothetical protein
MLLDPSGCEKDVKYGQAIERARTGACGNSHVSGASFIGSAWICHSDLKFSLSNKNSTRDSSVSVPLPALLINLRHMRQVNWARLGAAGSLAVSRIDQL